MKAKVNFLIVKMNLGSKSDYIYNPVTILGVEIKSNTL